MPFAGAVEDEDRLACHVNETATPLELFVDALRDVDFLPDLSVSRDSKGRAVQNLDIAASTADSWSVDPER